MLMNYFSNSSHNSQSKSSDEIRIVLIGKTGNGKSSLGNSILQSRVAFHSKQTSTSVTKNCQAETARVKDGQGKVTNLLVVDTPGFFDTNPKISNEAVEKRISSEIFEMTSPGVHAFLIVLRIGRFTPEEVKTIEFIQSIFGKDAAKYCIIVFTHVDCLDDGQSLKDFINDSPSLRDFADRCGNRTLGINNKLNGEPLKKKLNELIRMINDVVQANGGSYYTNDEYKKIEQQRKEEQRRREEEERKKKEEHDNEIRKKAQEEERKKAKAKLEKVQEEKQEAEERARQLQRELRNRREADCGDGFGGNMAALLSRMSIGDQGCPSFPYGGGSSFGGGMSRPSSGMGGAYGGRFTGEYMSTNGSANGRPIYEGSRGGQYYMTSGGNRRYI